MILKTAVQDKLNYYLSLQERCMLDESQRSDFVRTELGYSGQQSFVEMVGDYGVILWDATLSAPYLGSAQFDVLLITGSKIIHYDIKILKDSSGLQVGGWFQVITDNMITRNISWSVHILYLNGSCSSQDIRVK